MIYTVIVPKSSDIVKKEFESKVKEVGFNLFDTYNFTRMLQDNGCTVEKEIIVFELCNPPLEHNKHFYTYLNFLSIFHVKSPYMKIMI